MKIQLQFLRVVNCGPLRDVCIQFNTNGDTPVTVLAGANGSGKTTVLELCAALLELLNENSILSQQEVNKTPGGAILSRTGMAQLNLIVGDTATSVGYSENIAQVPDGVDYKVYRKSNRYFHEWRPDNNFIPQIIGLVKEQTLHHKEYKSDFALTKNDDATTMPAIIFFPHSRLLLPPPELSVPREETQYPWVYRYENVLSFVGSLDSYLIWLDYEEPEKYAQVIDFLNKLDFDGKKFSVLHKEKRAIVTTRDGQTHGVAELSSGEQNILIMLLELRRRLLPYSIVLIDEIENSLHAAFQHRLAQGLKRLQEMVPFQLIVTTHSSLFGRVFGPETVRILTEF